MAKEHLLLDNQICHSLYSASNALQRSYRKLLSPMGLTYPQYLILLALWEKDQVSVTSLSERTYFDSGTIAPLLKKLREKKLIQWKNDPKDRRSKIITLTLRGKQLESRADAIPGQLVCQMPYTLLELDRLRKTLQELHAHLRTASDKDAEP